MRIKLDENIADSAAVRLTALGHDFHTVVEEGLTGRTDSEIWIAAQTEERFLITQDLDFSDERRFAAGSHAGVLLVRLPDAEQWRISDYIGAGSLRPTQVPGDGGGRCFVVATPNKVRVRQPPGL
jgi:predicted nuclease of predicted toxin-antitoxin system